MLKTIMGKVIWPDNFYFLAAGLLLITEKLAGHTNYIIILLIIFSAIMLITKKITAAEVYMTGLVLPGEAWILLAVLLAIGILLADGKRMVLKGCVKLNLAVIGILAVINAIWSGTVFNVFFYCMYLLLLFCMALMLRKSVTETALFESGIKLCWIQIVLTIIGVCQAGSLKPGDNHFGSLKDAHEFGMWLLFIMTFMIFQMKKQEKVKRWITAGTLSGCLGALYLADAKHVVLAYMLALLVYGIVRRFRQKKFFVFGMMTAIIVIVYVAVFGLQIPAVKDFVKRSAGLYSMYLYDGDFNHKYNYYHGTLSEELTGIRFFTGFGLGQYGSRGANLFAYDIMYRNDNVLNRFVEKHFPAFCNENYRKYAEVYTEELVDSIWWKSAVLTYPFNSFLAFLAENGFIGVTGWLLLLNELYGKSKYKFFLCFFMLTCLFDLYIDHINVVGMLIILLAVRNEEGYEGDSVHHAFASCGGSGEGNFTFGKWFGKKKV